MKTNPKILVWAVVLLFFFSISTYGQESKKQLFVIHEDVVIPSMVSQYEKISKNLVSQLKDHSVSEISEMCAMTNDFHYYYITPVDNMAALDDNPWKAVEDKMGKEAFEKLWEGYADCYDVHSTYMLSFSPEDSYDPQSSKLMDSETLYRRWAYINIDPSKSEEGKKIVKEWKSLYEAKNIPTGYRTYWGGIGTEEPLLIVIEWAKDATALAAQRAKVQEMLGEDAKDLRARTLAVIRKYDVKEGTMRPDLSYMPEQVLADQPDQ